MPFNMKGTAKYSDDLKTPGARRLSATVEYKDAAPPIADKSIIIESSTGNYKLSALVPADATSPLLEQDGVFDAVTNYTTPTARAKVSRSFHQSLKITIKVVEPAATNPAVAGAASGKAS